MNWKDITEEQGRQWANHMRTRYRAGQLSPEQIADCESIPGWSWEYLYTFLSFEQARVIVHSLNLKNHKSWTAYGKSGERPLDIPSNPQHVYAEKGWVSWGDWLGTNVVSNYRKTFLPFSEARAFVRSLGLKSQKDWNRYCKSGTKPANIPASPDRIYAGKGWAGFNDWLGVHEKIFRAFADARAFAHSLGLKSNPEWRKYCKSGERPLDIPSSPDKIYKRNGWVNWGDWLGTGRTAYKNRDRLYRPFEEARMFARSLRLKDMRDWLTYCKANPRNDISTVPYITYADKGWISWGDWLGTGNTRGRYAKAAGA